MATLEGALGAQSANGGVLICDDPTIPVDLGTGERSFEYALAQRFLLRRVTFLNAGAVGRLEVSVAATDPAMPNGRWIHIASRNLAAGEREQVVKFAAVDCRYLRLRFVTTTPGKIFGLGAFGIRKAVEFYDPNRRGLTEDLQASAVGDGDDYVDVSELGPMIGGEDLNSAISNGLGWSHVEMVSSAASEDRALTARMLDEDSTTSYRFSEEDRSPKVVIDLGRVWDCGRVSVVYKSGERGTMKMWLADGAENSASVDVRLGTAELGLAIGGLRVRLERSLEDRSGNGRLSFNQFRRSGRYLILQWEPDVRSAKVGPGGFGISEVAVFEHVDGVEQKAPVVKLREQVIVTDPATRQPTTRVRDSKIPLLRPAVIDEPPVSR